MRYWILEKNGVEFDWIDVDVMWCGVEMMGLILVVYDCPVLYWMFCFTVLYRTYVDSK